MEIAHSADDTAEGRLEAVATAAADAGRPLRLRVPIQLWDGKNYQGWKDQTWKVEVKNAAEAVEFKAALEIFFRTLYRCGSARTVAALTAEQEQDNEGT